jgi:hypothetical protein
MKFWIPLIFGTIAVSAFLTYLNLYKGAQTLTVPPPPPPSAPAKLEFGSEPVKIGDTPAAKLNIQANVVELDAGICYVGESPTVGVEFKNTGEGPLELALEDFGNCDCASFYLDKKELTKTDPRFTIPPGKSATFKLTFKPQIRHVAEIFRTRASMSHNDQRFNDRIHIELVANVKPRR